MQRRQLSGVAGARDRSRPARQRDELIQTAKLAVVGQTMTTLAHEINQPLNALSMYLFTAGRAIEQVPKGGQAKYASPKRKAH